MINLNKLSFIQLAVPVACMAGSQEISKIWETLKNFILGHVTFKWSSSSYLYLNKKETKIKHCLVSFITI